VNLRTGLATGALALVVAILGGGCGVTPPQAPLSDIHKLTQGTTLVAEACGEAEQARAFDPHRGLSSERATAGHGASLLADVLRRAPDRVFLGETVRQIGATATGDLRGCGLGPAAAPLRAAGREPGVH
jgi:hypothetical protein